MTVSSKYQYVYILEPSIRIDKVESVEDAPPPKIPLYEGIVVTFATII